MNGRAFARPAVLAFAAGGALWLLAGALGRRREPWDSAAYWAIAYPLALVACAVLGWCYPERPARWAWALFAGQFVAMVVRNGGLGGMWPLGLAMFAVLALPGVLAARWAARLSRAGRGA